MARDERMRPQGPQGPPQKRPRVDGIDKFVFSSDTGVLSPVPNHLLDEILYAFTPKQLAQLATTCRDGRTIAYEFAKMHINEFPRARTSKLASNETWPQLLNFFKAQSAAASQATSLSLGTHHTVGLVVEEDPSSWDPRHGPISLRTWGKGFYGQLGSAAFEDHEEPGEIQLSTSLAGEAKPPPAVVACGNSHSMCISRRGELFTWGLASSGELGHGGRIPLGVPVPCQVRGALVNLRVVSISAGGNHSLAITEDGTLWSCGRGNSGQLGHGTQMNEGALRRVEHLRGLRIVSTAAGVAHSVALASDGTLFTWGDGRYGQLGHSALETLQNVVVNIALSKPWKVKALCPRKLLPTDRVTAIAAGGHHTMALTVGGELKVFGRNHHGQLGLRERTTRQGIALHNKWSPVTVPIDAPKGGNVRVVHAAAGTSHSLVLVHLNGVPVVLTAGSNCFGQLGHGDTAQRNEFTTVRGLCGRRIVALMSGDFHCAAVDPDGGVFMWGRGDSGQLGTGDTRCRWEPVKLRGLCAVNPDRTIRRKGGNDICIPKTEEELRAEENERREKDKTNCIPRYFSVVT